MRRRVDRALTRLTRHLAARRVAPESVTLAAAAVSVTAGIVLAAGGAAGKPGLWLFVPSLGLVRLALYALEVRLAARTRKRSSSS